MLGEIVILKDEKICGKLCNKKKGNCSCENSQVEVLSKKTKS